MALYAPTFRKDFQNDMYELDFDRIINSLSKRFGGNWKVLYRKHYFVNGKGTALPKCAIDVSDYEDMNELLAVSDVLISDYSSCLWDYSIRKLPAFIYATDINSYCESDCGFSYPFEKWPFPVATNNEELENCILNFR